MRTRHHLCPSTATSCLHLSTRTYFPASAAGGGEGTCKGADGIIIIGGARNPDPITGGAPKNMLLCSCACMLFCIWACIIICRCCSIILYCVRRWCSG